MCLTPFSRTHSLSYQCYVTSITIDMEFSGSVEGIFEHTVGELSGGWWMLERRPDNIRGCIVGKMFAFGQTMEIGMVGGHLADIHNLSVFSIQVTHARVRSRLVELRPACEKLLLVPAWTPRHNGYSPRARLYIPPDAIPDLESFADAHLARYVSSGRTHPNYHPYICLEDRYAACLASGASCLLLYNEALNGPSVPQPPSDDEVVGSDNIRIVDDDGGYDFNDEHIGDPLPGSLIRVEPRELIETWLDTCFESGNTLVFQEPLVQQCTGTSFVAEVSTHSGSLSDPGAYNDPEMYGVRITLEVVVHEDTGEVLEPSDGLVEVEAGEGTMMATEFLACMSPYISGTYGDVLVAMRSLKPEEKWNTVR
ncbi:hypothetical protein PENSPDRAFT_670075 [Peniophora sp. CONT]|nr:hypothetical protein PENSPDRAFT_670075 [Peniophora sp. CONT]